MSDLAPNEAAVQRLKKRGTLIKCSISATIGGMVELVALANEAMLPMTVRCPVATTTHTALPSSTLVPVMVSTRWVNQHTVVSFDGISQ